MTAGPGEERQGTVRVRRRPPSERPRWQRLLHAFATSPRTKLVAGSFLLVTALANLVEGALFDLDETLDPAHALLVLGALMVVQGLAEFLEALEFFDEAGDER